MTTRLLIFALSKLTIFSYDCKTVLGFCSDPEEHLNIVLFFFPQNQGVLFVKQGYELPPKLDKYSEK